MMGLRQRLSKRLSASFGSSGKCSDSDSDKLRGKKGHGCTGEDKVDGLLRPNYDREDSDSSRLSVGSTNSLSSASLHSGTSLHNARRKEGNWFFSEDFCYSYSLDSLTTRSDQVLDKRGMPLSDERVLILPLWTINVKGMLYQKLKRYEKEWIRKLPRPAQESISNLYKQITIFDYENSEFNVRTNKVDLLLPEETEAEPESQNNSHSDDSTVKQETDAVRELHQTISRSDGLETKANTHLNTRSNKPVSKSINISRNKKHSGAQNPLDKRSIFADKRSVSGFLTLPRSSLGKSARKLNVGSNILDHENAVLKDYGLEAVLCKHESHYVGGSIVLTYYIRLEQTLKHPQAPAQLTSSDRPRQQHTPVSSSV